MALPETSPGNPSPDRSDLSKAGLSKAGLSKTRDRLLEGLRRAPEDVAALGRRSRGVTIAKRALPAFAAALLVALAAVPALRSAGRVSYHISSAGKPDAGSSSMQGARYRGVDADGEPYTLTASGASQGADGVVALTNPAGDLTLKSGSWVMLNSRHGTYHQDSELLALNGDVTLYRDDGTIVKTTHALLNLKGGTAQGADPVHAEGPFGTLDARSGFTIGDRGENITFLGPATLMLQPAPASAPMPGGSTPQ